MPGVHLGRAPCRSVADIDCEMDECLPEPLQPQYHHSFATLFCQEGGSRVAAYRSYCSHCAALVAQQRHAPSLQPGGAAQRGRCSTTSSSGSHAIALAGTLPIPATQDHQPWIAGGAAGGWVGKRCPKIWGRQVAFALCDPRRLSMFKSPCLGCCSQHRAAFITPVQLLL